MNLKQLQDEVTIWTNHNFPNAESHQPLLGAFEEVGELAHAHLKEEQGIRGTLKEHTKAKIDAVGDIIIFLAHYCTLSCLDLNICVEMAWNESSKRDWIKYPFDGTSV